MSSSVITMINNVYQQKIWMPELFASVNLSILSSHVKGDENGAKKAKKKKLKHVQVLSLQKLKRLATELRRKQVHTQCMAQLLRSYRGS